VEVILPGRNKAHHSLRKRFRSLAFDALKQKVNAESRIIMTSSTANVVRDIEIFAEHVDIPKARRVPFAWVNLVCDDEVHLKRPISKDRCGKRSKLVGKEELLKVRKAYELLMPEDCEGVKKDTSAG
jgi:hypothetical protein